LRTHCPVLIRFCVVFDATLAELAGSVLESAPSRFALAGFYLGG